MTRSIWKRYEKRLIRFGSKQEQDETLKLRFTALPKIHFTHDMLYVSQQTASYATVYSLLTIAVLIILIAMINFVNFTVSRIPSRIRHINTQKILGETNARLRLRSIAESVVFIARFIIPRSAARPIFVDDPGSFAGRRVD